MEQPVALTPEQYRAELAQQAQEAKARKAAARVAEKLADKREVEEQLRRGALEKYDAHVGRRNDKLSAKVRARGSVYVLRRAAPGYGAGYAAVEGLDAKQHV